MHRILAVGEIHRLGYVKPQHSNNEKLKNCLEVNCGRSIPDESALRKNYLSKFYNNILEMIRNKVDGKKIMWQTSLLEP
jgi:hypothetical protein